MKQVNRRQFLRLAATGLGATALAACAAPTAAPPQVVTVVVKETQIVEGEVKTVEKVVEKQVTVAPTAVPPKPKQTKGTLWGLQYDPHVEEYNRLADLFNKKTGMTMAVEPQAWPLETKLLAALAAGTQPDVACIMGKMCVPLYIGRVLLPLKEAVYNANGTNLEKDYFGDGLGAYAWDGDYYGVPMENGMIGNTVSVPTDDIKKLGLQSKYPPTNGNWLWESYEQLWEAAKALQIEEGGKVKRYGISSKGWDAAAIIGILRTNGENDKIDWWDVTKQQFNVDTEYGVKAFWYHDEEPVKRGIEAELDVSSVDAAMSGRAALARGNATPVVLGHTVGFVYEGSEVPPTLPGQKKPITMGEGGWGFVSPKQAKNLDVAVAFLRLMDSDEGAYEWEHIYGGKKGPRTKWASDFTMFKDQDPNSPNMKFNKFVLANNMWASAKYYGEQMGYPGTIDGIFGSEASEIRSGKKTAAQAAKSAQERLIAQRQGYLDDVKRYQAG